jgi:hypothetical protein
LTIGVLTLSSLARKRDLELPLASASSSPAQGQSRYACSRIEQLSSNNLFFPSQVAETRKTKPTSYFASWQKWLPIMKAYEAGNPSYFATPPGMSILFQSSTQKSSLIPVASQSYLRFPSFLGDDHSGQGQPRAALCTPQTSQRAHQTRRCRARSVSGCHCQFACSERHDRRM